MTAGTKNIKKGSDEYDPTTGICGSHAYSLISVHQIIPLGGGNYAIDQKNNPKSIKLLQLRNPWGQNEWMGEWSDRDKKWTNPQLRKILNHESLNNDGDFFISFEDFKRFFDDFQICYYHDGYDYSAIKLKNNSNDIIFLKFTIKNAGKYYFSLNQHNKRRFSKSKRYNYSDCSFLVAQLKPDGESMFVGGGI